MKNSDSRQSTQGGTFVNLMSDSGFIESRTMEFAPSTIIINFVETARFTKTMEACESPCDYLLYWFLNGWKYNVNGILEVLKDIPEVKQLSAACEIVAFSPAKRTLYNRSVYERTRCHKSALLREGGRPCRRQSRGSRRRPCRRKDGRASRNREEDAGSKFSDRFYLSDDRSFERGGS